VRLYCLALLGFHGCQVGELVLPITSCLFVYFAGADHGGPLSLGYLGTYLLCLMGNLAVGTPYPDTEV
jgi:hypothetical protein